MMAFGFQMGLFVPDRQTKTVGLPSTVASYRYHRGTTAAKW